MNRCLILLLVFLSLQSYGQMYRWQMDEGDLKVFTKEQFKTLSQSGLVNGDMTLKVQKMKDDER